MVTKRDDDDDRPTDDRVNIEQSASGRLEGRVLQFLCLLNKVPETLEFVLVCPTPHFNLGADLPEEGAEGGGNFYLIDLKGK